MTNMLKIHPAADCLPLLPDSEFAQLKADIKARGLREPILVKDGFIVDGRHRYRACNELGIDPTLQEYDDGDIIAEIASRNLFRRNLTPQERAELVVKMCGDKLRADARARQRSGLKKGDKIPVTLKSAPRGETAERIAAIAKVGRDTARQALRVHRDGAPKKSKRPKPKVDKTSREFVMARFQRFMDFWSVTQHRTVKPFIHDFTAP
jgi:hypothetical protein